jgi:hypothetical protein
MNNIFSLYHKPKKETGAAEEPEPASGRMSRKTAKRKENKTGKI